MVNKYGKHWHGQKVVEHELSLDQRLDEVKKLVLGLALTT